MLDAPLERPLHRAEDLRKVGEAALAAVGPASIVVAAGEKQCFSSGPMMVDFTPSRLFVQESFSFQDVIDELFAGPVAEMD